MPSTTTNSNPPSTMPSTTPMPTDVSQSAPQGKGLVDRAVRVITTSAQNLTGTNPDLTYQSEQPIVTPPPRPENFMDRAIRVILHPMETFGHDVSYVRHSLNKYALMQAFVGQESGGDYGAVSKAADSKGRRAYGKYQILESNIPAWTKQVLGKPMTKQQFRKDKNAQDKVFDWHLQNLINQYGNLDDIASVYFSGGTFAENKNKKDGSGKTVQQYTSDIKKRYAQLAGVGAVQ